MKIGTVKEGWGNEMRIIWDDGEFERLEADLSQNQEDLRKIKPENALKSIRLLALYKMGEKAYSILKPGEEFSFKGSTIFTTKEECLFLSIFGGTFIEERGRILWELLDAVSQGLASQQ